MGTLPRCAAALALACSLHAQAALEAMGSQFGPGTVIRDDASGLDWLRLDVQRELSSWFADNSYLFFKEETADGSLAGWQISSLATILTLFENAEIPPDAPPALGQTPEAIAAGRRFGELFGAEHEGEFGHARAYWQNDDIVTHFHAGVSFGPTSASFYADGAFADPRAAWLSRPAQVAAIPEPQTYALLAIGLALIGIARRRWH